MSDICTAEIAAETRATLAGAPDIATTTVTLVSATSGDQVLGVEISDPASPVAWADLDEDAQDWARAQGYGPGAEDELLYVLDGVGAPDGFPSYSLEIAVEGDSGRSDSGPGHSSSLEGSRAAIWPASVRHQ